MAAPSGQAPVPRSSQTAGATAQAIPRPLLDDPQAPEGKVLRINPDGSIPADNPFVGRAGARPEIYAYGLREDQGVAIHPRTGVLWASENGPKGETRRADAPVQGADRRLATPFRDPPEQVERRLSFPGERPAR